MNEIAHLWVSLKDEIEKGEITTDVIGVNFQRIFKKI